MFVVASHATFDEALERVGSGNTSTLAADLLATGRSGQKKIFGALADLWELEAPFLDKAVWVARR